MSSTRALRHRAAAAAVAALMSCGCGSFAGDEPESASPDTTRLAVIGDFGTGGDGAHAVAEAIRDLDEEHALDALVTTGDNVYPDGDPEDFDRAWTKPYGWVEERGIAVVASLGNHDVEGGHEEEQMELLGMPDRWYTRTVGRVQLVVLDANLVGDDRQQAFLVSTLDAPPPDGATYRVVVFHQAAYSCGQHGSTDEVLEEWVPLFADAEVDLVLNGHDHVYQRFAAIDGTTYVVTGGGGADLYEMEGCPEGTPEPQKVARELHFLELEASADGLDVEAVAPDGQVLDQTRLPAGG